MDHSLSALSGRDCKVLRLASAKAICLEEPPGVDFDGGLTARDGALVGEIKACALPDIVRALPDRTSLNQCAETLVARFGQPGAVSYSDWHITQLIDAGHTDDAGVWFGIRAAVKGTPQNKG